MDSVEERRNMKFARTSSMEYINARQLPDYKSSPQTKAPCIRSLTSSALYCSPRLVITKRVEVNGWRSDGIGLFRPEAGKQSLQPILFHRYEEASPRAKLLLAFRAALVENATGVMPALAK
jgi:hypothetical protein